MEGPFKYIREGNGKVSRVIRMGTRKSQVIFLEAFSYAVL
uniref:Uncharacterized protein n=1 Tax=Sinocyclocheilus anshuiensis TaxID=1608454 RepID=A0A671MMG9_9TELE